MREKVNMINPIFVTFRTRKNLKAISDAYHHYAPTKQSDRLREQEYLTTAQNLDSQDAIALAADWQTEEKVQAKYSKPVG